jgi:GT2 family glycosyltransferase
VPEALAIIIVAYGNPADIQDTLAALCRADPEPAFAVHICENGGTDAYRALINLLTRDEGLLTENAENPWLAGHVFREVRAFRLRTGTPVFIGDAGENLGYGGGLNRWLTPLMAAGTPSVFVLNPDAAPAPDALGRLATYAAATGKGMVTGRIVLEETPDRIQTRGLRFNPWRVQTQAVGRLEASNRRPDIAEIERLLDAPSGAAVYVTAGCLQQIGLLREDYFLYYEDLDWGLRAKRCCGIGYAYDAVIVHKGGTTIGRGNKRTGSALATYLEFRNRLRFVAAEWRWFYPWALFVSTARALEYLAYRRPDRTKAAFRGLLDALRGVSGRPEAMLRQHAALLSKGGTAT